MGPSGPFLLPAAGKADGFLAVCLSVHLFDYYPPSATMPASLRVVVWLLKVFLTFSSDLGNDYGVSGVVLYDGVSQSPTQGKDPKP
jgi:hypothetical protein